MASSDGLYTFGSHNLSRHDSSNGNSFVQCAYSGFDVWDVTGCIAGGSSTLTYDRSAINDGSGDYGGQYYKIPLAALAARMPAGGTEDGSLGFVPAIQSCIPGEVKAFDLVIDRLSDGLSGYELNVALNVTGAAEIVGVSFPSWATIRDNSTLPADTVNLRAADLMQNVGTGASNVTLVTLFVRGDLPGAARLDVDVVELDSDSGSPLDAGTCPGVLVISPPSFVVSLSPGWNLISWPVDNNTLRASDLVNNASLGVDMVTRYSPLTGMFSSYYRGANPSKDFVMTPDAGYFAKAGSAGSFGVAGESMPAHYIPLNNGWNLIGWSCFTSVYASDVLAGAACLDLVTAYSPATGMFKSYYRGANPSKNFALTAGGGYFVKSASAGEQQLYIG
jgi:hypothetical protein